MISFSHIGFIVFCTTLEFMASCTTSITSQKQWLHSLVSRSTPLMHSCRRYQFSQAVSLCLCLLIWFWLTESSQAYGLLVSMIMWMLCPLRVYSSLALIAFIIFRGGKTITTVKLLLFAIAYMAHIVIRLALRDMDINVIPSYFQF